MISALGAQVLVSTSVSLQGAFRDSPNAILALVSLYTVVFVLLLATVLFEE